MLTGLLQLVGAFIHSVPGIGPPLAGGVDFLAATIQLIERALIG
jgi:hypothetical protein